MSKLTEYSAATRFDSGDILIKDGTNGTKKITVANAAVEFAGLVSSVNHRNIYRGKSLGSTVTDDQKTAISSGTFDDLFIGDYWSIDDVIYRIADMDYWYNVGDTAFTTHHLVMVSDKFVASAAMNSTNTTAEGYVGSKMYTETLPMVTETIRSAFGDMLLTHREYLTNAVTSGYPSGGAWYDSSVEIMSEKMIFGTNIMAPMGNGSVSITNTTSSKTQLALFALNTRMINTKGNYYWTRDVVNSSTFAGVNTSLLATAYNASSICGVRPVFPIGV